MATDGHIRNLSDELQHRLRAPFDHVLVDPVRLRIQATLCGLPTGSMNFTALGRALALSDGNLGGHLTTLIEVGYIETEVTWQGRRKTTWYRATPAGRAAFAEHVRSVRSVIDASAIDT